MKIQKNYFLLCENAIVGERGKLSLINIYELIYAEKLPASHGKLILVSSFTLDIENSAEDKVIVSLDVISPSKKSMLEKEILVEKKLDEATKKQTIGDVLEVNGVVFSEYGQYECVLKVNSYTYSLFFDVKKPLN